MQQLLALMMLAALQVWLVLAQRVQAQRVLAQPGPEQWEKRLAP